ncbi:V-type proton ATPase subunit D [Paramicrosporidium saccamoebae]|uniref:V-type proton ATPase subunit D n=1 Tax=Paramicrosporidium saccamoebae TaxID=1246581 RepID=A0A2H9THX2_9FUNG|nr:V-type proton ATPase subunit D [Paramicrosporidium saccamoebae]
MESRPTNTASVQSHTPALSPCLRHNNGFQSFPLECNLSNLSNRSPRALNNMKIKLKGAQKGHSLLKRKSDALTARFRIILQRIRDAKLLMGKTMRQAAFALAEVNFAAGDISFAVREKVGSAAVKVRARMENVSGVQLPVFECVGTGGEAQWLGRGGQQVQKCREAFSKSLQALVDLAALQTAFFLLDEVIQATNRRVNALEYVVLPKVDNTVAYITSELDEQDREDFFRLKKVQSNKKKENEQIEDGSKLSQCVDTTALEESSRSMLLDEEDAEVFV